MLFLRYLCGRGNTVHTVRKRPVNKQTPLVQIAYTLGDSLGDPTNRRTDCTHKGNTPDLLEQFNQRAR